MGVRVLDSRVEIADSIVGSAANHPGKRKYRVLPSRSKLFITPYALLRKKVRVGS